MILLYIGNGICYSISSLRHTAPYHLSNRKLHDWYHRSRRIDITSILDSVNKIIYLNKLLFI